MVRTLAPHTTSEIQEGHISEDIPYVIPHPKSQDRDACSVCEQCDFAALAGTASCICVVDALMAVIG